MRANSLVARLVGTYLLSWYLATAAFFVLYWANEYMDKSAGHPSASTASGVAELDGLTNTVLLQADRNATKTSESGVLVSTTNIALSVLSGTGTNDRLSTNDSAASQQETSKSAGDATLSDFASVLLGVLILGALGNVVTCTMRFVRPGDDEKTAAWYLFMPWIGMLMAAFFFIAMRSGVLALTGTADFNTLSTNPNIYFFMAMIAGLFSEKAYRKLEEMGGTILNAEEKPQTEHPNGALVPGEARNKRIDIKPATLGLEREEVYKLRYRILVEGEGWNLAAADQDGRIVKDDYDHSAKILVARVESLDIHGSVRTNFWKELGPRLWNPEKNVPKILADLGISLPKQISRDICSYTSRLVSIHQNEMGRYAPGIKDINQLSGRDRHSPGTALCLAAYDLGVSHGIQIDWITCNRADVRYYEKFGYRMFLEELDDPEFALDPRHNKSFVMYLLLEDLEFLKEKRSPFRHFCRQDEQNPARYKDLLELIETQRRTIKSSLAIVRA